MQIFSLSRILLFVLFSTFQLVALAKDYYEILELKPDATAQEIKKNFRRLSLKYHPDKNPGDDVAHQKFVDVNEANEVLSNDEKRQIYDLEGMEGLERDKKGGGAGSIFDLFTGQQTGGRRKGPDFRMDYQVTLEQLYNGATTVFNVKRNVLCKKCRGTGAKEGATKKCPKCNGQGVTMSIQELGPGFKVQMQTTCDHCGGKGKIPKSVCPICGGKKVYMEEKALQCMIEKGMPDNHEIVFEKASEQSPDSVPGDVILVLRTLPHPRYTRNGNDLHTELTISLKEALLGFTKHIDHLDGRQIRISTDSITPPDHVKMITGEGMPHHNFPSERGNLHVKFIVAFPTKLTDKQKKEVERLLLHDS